MQNNITSTILEKDASHCMYRLWETSGNTSMLSRPLSLYPQPIIITFDCIVYTILDIVAEWENVVTYLYSLELAQK